MANFLQANQPASSVRYDPKLYIKDTNGAWVDFSASTGYGTNRLAKIGSISNKVETELGVLVTTIQSVSLNNKDGFFNKPFPSTLLTLGGSSAVFLTSQGYKLPALRGCEVKVSVQIRFENEFGSDSNVADPRDVVQEEPLGIFFIDDVTPDTSANTVVLKLISQDGRLAGKEADGIKDGFGWYQYRPVSFLMEQVLKSEYAENGLLPTGYSIDKTNKLDTLNNTLATSVMGQPPLWDGTNWRRDGLYARAICHANIGGGGKKVYLGCDNQLWSYNPITATYALCGSIESGKNIRFLDVDRTYSSSFSGVTDRGNWKGGKSHATFDVKVTQAPAISTPSKSGTGTSTMTATGIYTGAVTAMYEVKITVNGTPDRFQWRRSDNGGTNWTAWGGVAEGDTTSTDVVTDNFTIPDSRGVVVDWDSTTTSALNDIWSFTATAGICQWRRDSGAWSTDVNPLPLAASPLSLGWGVSFWYNTGSKALNDQNTYTVAETNLIVMGWEDPKYTTYAESRSIQFHGWYSSLYYYNGTSLIQRSGPSFSFTKDTGTGTATLVPSGYYTGNLIQSYEIKITVDGTNPTPDQFQWRIAGGTWSSDITCVSNSSPVHLEKGLYVGWTSIYNSNTSDTWTITPVDTQIIPQDRLYVRSAYNGTGYTYVGYLAAARAVENISIPFPQHIHCTTSSASATTNHVYIDDSNSSPLADTGTSNEALDIIQNGSWYGFVSRGHARLKVDGSTGSDAILPFWAVGQKPLAFLSPYKSGTARYAYWTRWTDDSQYNYLHVSDTRWFQTTTTNGTYSGVWAFSGQDVNSVSRITQTIVGLVVTSGPTYDYRYGQQVPVCMFPVNGVTNQAVLITWRLHGSTGGANMVPEDAQNMPYKSYSSCWNLTDVGFDTSVPTTGRPYQLNTNQTGDGLYWMPINGCGFDSNSNTSSAGDNVDKVVIVWFNRKTLTYALLHHNTRDFMNATYTVDAYANGTKLRYSAMPFTGLCSDITEDCIYAYGIGEGKVLKVTKSGTCTVVNEVSIVSDESGLLAGLTCDQGHDAGIPDIWGITSPMVQLESYYAYQPGKYSLFRVTDSISDIVEFAQFESLNKWDVIKQLAQSRDGIAFFDRNGNFRYVPRVYASATADYTLKTLGTDANEIPILKVTPGYGFNKVINVARVQAYNSTFGIPNMDALSLIRRTTNNSKNKNANDLKFVDYTIEQRDVLKKKVLAYCVQGGNPTTGQSKWKYSIVHREVEAIAKGNISSSATDIPVQSVFSGGDTSTAENLQGIMVGDFASVSDDATGNVITRTITVVDSANNDFTISSSFGIAIKDGSIITISKAFQTSGSPTYNRAIWSDEGVGYVSATTTSPATFSMTATLPQPIAVGSIVRIGNDYHEYRVTAKDVNKYTVEQIENTGTSTWHSTPSTGNVVYAYWSPNRSYPGQIGDSNVFVDFMVGTGTAESSFTEEFLPGDRLVIDCPGQSLQADSRAVQVTMATNSIARNKRKEIAIDNRFMNVAIANEIAKRLIYYYSEPKFELTVSIPLAPYMDIVTNSGTLTVVDVYLPDQFLTSYNFTERFLINGITHNFDNFETTLNLQGLDAY